MKYFFIKLVCFITVVVVFQAFLYAVFYRTHPAFPELDSLNRYISEERAIIYLGDSTNATFDENDTDRRAISDFLEDDMSPLRIGVVAHGAYSLDQYLDYYKYILKSGYQPKVIIIPVNIHSFSPSWDLRPGYQFEWESEILQKGRFAYYMFYRPLSFFGLSSPITEEKFMSAPVFNGDTRVGSVKDFEMVEWGMQTDDSARMRTLYGYLFSLDPFHRKLESLRTLIRLRSPRTKMLFYVTPINYQKGEKYFPGVFTERLEQNIAVIQSDAVGAGVQFLDLGTLLESNDFVNADSPYLDEHLNERGRRAVAEKLSEIITTFH